MERHHKYRHRLSGAMLWPVRPGRSCRAQAQAAGQNIVRRQHKCPQFKGFSIPPGWRSACRHKRWINPSCEARCRCRALRRNLTLPRRRGCRIWIPAGRTTRPTPQRTALVPCSTARTAPRCRHGRNSWHTLSLRETAKRVQRAPPRMPQRLPRPMAMIVWRRPRSILRPFKIPIPPPKAQPRRRSAR